MSTKMPSRLAIVVILILCLPSCARPRPILIGFSAELTGRRAELGVAARDGAQLAVDVINGRDGIRGRPLELIVKNDRGDPDLARQVDAELIQAGVVAIVGHITSNQTAAVFDQINEAQVVLISPTSSSTLFDGQADYFFRVMPSNESYGRSLARHIHNVRNVRQLAAIYDLGNPAFTETLWQAIRTEFERLGGDAGPGYTFTSGETDLQALIGKVAESNPEAIVLIASAVDTALMIQYADQHALQAKRFSSSWAQTQELFEKGGRAVEGLEMIATYNPQNSSLAFQQFAERYRSRYRREPSLAAAYAYEAVLVLAKALEQTRGQSDGLPAALVAIDKLPGVQGMISIDTYGDVERDTFIVVVQDGQFQVINTFPASD